MDAEEKQPEVWMRGPIPQVPALLQPVAHAILQVNEDIQKIDSDKYEKQLWIKPYGMASIAFHLQHIAGVIDRLMTYSRGESLNEEQFDSLSQEGQRNDNLCLEDLKGNLERTVEVFIAALKRINPDSLTEERFLGRKKIPTTQMGLLFHAAEHAQRHYGQLLVTLNLLHHMDHTA